MIYEIGMVKNGTDGREKLIDDGVYGLMISIMQKFSRLEKISQISQKISISTLSV